MSPSGWIEFWDSKHSIYVNAVHQAAHFRRIAADMMPYVPQGGTMLDYGCGEALGAPQMAERAARLTLCDPAPHVSATLRSRFANNSKIAVQSPDEIAATPDASFDVVVMHSVAQYLSVTEFATLVRMFRRLLRPNGLLVVGDVIPTDLPMLADVTALLRFGSSEGFLGAALGGLVRTFFSDYRTLRHSLGLTRYDATDMMARLRAAGFSVERARSNIGHNNRRMTFLAHAR